MASPMNQHCANCIGTVSLPIYNWYELPAADCLELNCYSHWFKSNHLFWWTTRHQFSCSELVWYSVQLPPRLLVPRCFTQEARFVRCVFLFACTDETFVVFVLHLFHVYILCSESPFLSLAPSLFSNTFPSVLWYFWLGDRKCIWPAKTMIYLMPRDTLICFIASNSLE